MWNEFKTEKKCVRERLVGWLVGFLTSSSTTRLYRGRAPRQSVWQFYVLPHMRQSWETMTSVSAGHIILTPTQPVGSGRPQRESNPGPPHQESRALPTKLPRPPVEREKEVRDRGEEERGGRIKAPGERMKMRKGFSGMFRAMALRDSFFVPSKFK